MKMAVTVWDNRISPVADSARHLLVAQIHNQKIQGLRYDYFDQESLFYRARKLADLDIKILVCGAISYFYSTLIEGYGIRVIPFIRGEVNEVLEAYLDQSLSSPRFVMTGCVPEPNKRR